MTKKKSKNSGDLIYSMREQAESFMFMLENPKVGWITSTVHA